MKSLLKKLMIASSIFSPVLAFAHPGHDQTHTGFEAGFLHPFTGIDHMMMAFALGVLLYSSAQRWKMFGLLGMIVALSIGFIIGQSHLIPAQFAEYGIGTSLFVVGIALFSNSKIILPIATALLVTFHGVAHGAELGHSGHALALVSGMIAAMSMIYVIGLAFGHFVVQYIPYGKKIVGGLAAMIALITLA
ncbi:HupE/UreJ family protein [Acinetobacter gerneri]|uniref:HupE/UreJ family protein n=1 Tax=Acinetobacter gerneri TaxID=202952 RepID=UPI0028A82036|nr:HupE/UreJ family protein [Acinetobacter gerneri]